MDKKSQNFEERVQYLKEKAKEVRVNIIDMIFIAQSGHPGGALSAADIMTALYFDILKIDPKNPRWPDRDRFILSKGHACPVWYSCLAMRGYFPMKELKTLRKFESILQGHPDMLKTPGVDITTGSLGQGLSLGVGMALEGKLVKKNYHVYVILGDGEINEGGAMMKLSKADIATRQAFSERMLEYGEIDKDFVVFEADIGYSTFSYLFGDAYPERYFNMGIAESNTMAAAAGMAADGRTVIACSYGVFITMRAVEAIRTFICYPNLNVKFLSSHGGVTPAIDGVTHQATEDIGIMTTLPNMKVLAPADTESAKKIFDVAIKTPGPVFVRLMRDPLFDIYSKKDTFKLEGSKTIRKGKDITVVTYGDTIFQALEAADELEKENISSEIIDTYSIKPFDKKNLIHSISKTGVLLVVEDHQKRNGLGYELSNFCLKNKPVIFDNLGLNDTFAESGNYYKVIDKYGISKKHIFNKAKELISKKGSENNHGLSGKTSSN